VLGHGPTDDFGNSRDADFDNTGSVNFADLGQLKSSFGG